MATYMDEIKLWPSELRCHRCGDVNRRHADNGFGGTVAGCTGFVPIRPSAYGALPKAGSRG